jgi:hypothetical protein
MNEKLQSLLERLTFLAEEDGRWEISSDEVAALLDVDPVAFWRAVAALRDRIDFADAIDGWTEESVGDLVTVLEHLHGAGSEQAITRAGLFIPSALGIELAEELLFHARRFCAAHVVNEEELAAMLRHTGRVRAAIDLYLEHNVDLDALIDGCAESFRVLRGFPLAGRLTAARFLSTMFVRHILDRRGLLVLLLERLRIAAGQMGFFDPDDRAREEAARSASGREPMRRAWARRVMGIGGKIFTAEEVRARYRQLMMRHHPDVDPGGLELCKDVNVAYSLLISEMANGA